MDIGKPISCDTQLEKKLGESPKEGHTKQRDTQGTESLDLVIASVKRTRFLETDRK